MSFRILIVFTITCCHFFTTQLHAQQESSKQLREQIEIERLAKQQALQRTKNLSSVSFSSANQQKFDVTYYRLNLKIDPAAQMLSGSVEVQGRSLAVALDSIELDLYANVTVDSVAQDAQSFTRQGNKLYLHLKNTLSNDAAFGARIYYSGRPNASGFGGFVFDQQERVPLIWTLSEPYYARSWWPCKDTPSDKADSVDIIVTVPAGLIVASNGSLIDQTENGDGTTTFHWQERYPITTYLISLAITNYATFSQWFRYSPTDSMEMRHYIYPSRLQRARNDLQDLPEMMHYFHDTFGPYPFLKEKYGIAQFGWGGGMEHQTITSQGSFGQTLSMHELAHQWWGDMITNANWPEIWLNEGFASYSEALYYEHKNGIQFYHQYMATMDRNFTGSIYRQDTTSVSSIFNFIVYDKGAWVLHMLRKIVGDSAFFEILPAYASDPRFKHGNATTAGFRDVCEKVAGQELGWFFDPWIFGTGRPFYKYGWTLSDSAGFSLLHLNIRQAQFPQHQLFAMPIDILIKSANTDTTVAVFCDKETQDFTIRLPQRLTSVTLDPDGWILKNVQEVQTGLDERAPVDDFALYQNYPNPFNGETTIEFELAKDTVAEVTIFNTSGQLVRTLTSGLLKAGPHRLAWDGRDDNSKTVSSGVYVYRLRVNGFTESKKLILMK